MRQQTSSPPESTNSADDSALEILSQLPPSAKLIAITLKYNETLTHAQLVDETLLPERTVRYALNKLDNHDLVESQICFADARKRSYSLAFEY